MNAMRVICRASMVLLILASLVMAVRATELFIIVIRETELDYIVMSAITAGLLLCLIILPVTLIMALFGHRRANVGAMWLYLALPFFIHTFGLIPPENARLAWAILLVLTAFVEGTLGLNVWLMVGRDTPAAVDRDEAGSSR